MSDHDTPERSRALLIECGAKQCEPEYYPHVSLLIIEPPAVSTHPKMLQRMITHLHHI
jgi:hypothetical protein